MTKMPQDEINRYAVLIVSAAPTDWDRRATDEEFMNMRRIGIDIHDRYGIEGMEVVMRVVEKMSERAESACDVAWDEIGGAWFA